MIVRIEQSIPSAKNADSASNFVVSTNYRIDLALFRKRSEIDRIFIQRVETLLRRLGLHPSVTPDLLNSGLQGRFREVVLLQYACYRRVLDEGKEDVILSDVGVVHGLLQIVRLA